MGVSLQDPRPEAPHMEETPTVLDRHERLPRWIEEHYRLSLSHKRILKKSFAPFCALILSNDSYPFTASDRGVIKSNMKLFFCKFLIKQDLIKLRHTPEGVVSLPVLQAIRRKLIWPDIYPSWYSSFSRMLRLQTWAVSVMAKSYLIGQHSYQGICQSKNEQLTNGITEYDVSNTSALWTPTLEIRPPGRSRSKPILRSPLIPSCAGRYMSFHPEWLTFIENTKSFQSYL